MKTILHSFADYLQFSRRKKQKNGQIYLYSMLCFSTVTVIIWILNIAWIDKKKWKHKNYFVWGEKTLSTMQRTMPFVYINGQNCNNEYEKKKCKSKTVKKSTKMNRRNAQKVGSCQNDNQWVKKKPKTCQKIRQSWRFENEKLTSIWYLYLGACERTMNNQELHNRVLIKEVWIRNEWMSEFET